MDKFRQCLTELSVHPFIARPFVLSFQGNNLSKYQSIFTKLGMCHLILGKFDLELLTWQSSHSNKVIYPLHDSSGVLSLIVFFFLSAFDVCKL